MELKGDREIAVPRSQVWEGLNDPEVLKDSIPGCEEFDGNIEEGYQIKVTQKIGPVKATFRGHIDLDDINPENSYTLKGEAKAGAAGMGSGVARVKLSDIDSGTFLEYEVDAKLGGKIAQLGSRLVGGVAKKLADKFFTKFQEVVEEKNTQE